MRTRDHVFTAPLDHADPSSPPIRLFAREVVGADHLDEDLPWLCFLNGGPGMAAPRPPAPSWLPVALRTHRVLLLDQRGTGRSTPLTARTARGRTAAQLAAYIALLRADSIVADAELVRHRLTGGLPWTTLGQSYGGFVSTTYLSMAPHGLSACLVAGGLPAPDSDAAAVYARLYPRVRAKNSAYYQRYPEDVDRVRAVADRLARDDVRLPDGDRLHVARLRSLGKTIGTSGGFERVHWLIENAWNGDEISDSFRYDVMAMTAFTTGPLFALQEYIYGQPGLPTRWAADRALAGHPGFAADATPLLFTGEMMYRWMFDDIRALRPFAGAADLLAERADWPCLYDTDRLACNEVPVIAAIYANDMHVDAELQLATAKQVGNVRALVTDEYEHDGLTASDGVVLQRLLDMMRHRC